MFTFTDLIHVARCFVVDQVIKAAGHKYIKRIPISSNPTKYRYIYSATSTVGGKNILDEAHLKVGTKLMLQSEAGAQVHAHVEKVSGDKVKVVYDDGDKKGQSRTFTKQQLLNQFNEEHGISDQLTAAKDKLLADIQSAVAGGTISEKQLARLVERLESLDPASKGTEQGGAKDRIKQAASEYVQSLKDISEALQSRDSAAYQKAIKDVDTNNKALKAEMEKELVVEGKTPQEQAATLKELRPFVDQIINNPLRNIKGIPREALVFYSDAGRDLKSKLDKYERDIEEHQTELQEQDDDFKKVQAYDVDPSDVAPADLQRELKRVQDIRALSDKLTDRYPNAGANNYKLDTNSRGKLQRVEDSLKQRIQSNQGTLDAKQLAGLKRGDTLQYKGKSYSVRSKRNLKGINGFKITLDAKDGSDTMSLKVYPEGVAAADKSPVIVSDKNDLSVP